MIIIRYRELSLKGKNRPIFERALVRNIKDCLKKNAHPFKNIMRIRGRILVDADEPCPYLEKVFGIASWSYAKEYALDEEQIKQAALEYYKGGRFRITCQRMEDFSLSSMELEREVGAYIVEKTGAKVKLKDPDQEIHIEICNGHAYIFTEKIQGPGGLPITKEAHAVLLLQNKDSLQAGILMMKRGCTIHVYKEKNIDWTELKEYEYGFHIKELQVMPKDAVFIVSDTLETLRDYPFFVFRPLIGVVER